MAAPVKPTRENLINDEFFTMYSKLSTTNLAVSIFDYQLNPLLKLCHIEPPFSNFPGRIFFKAASVGADPVWLINVLTVKLLASFCLYFLNNYT